MKRAFTMHVEDGVKIIGLQIGIVVQRESNGEKGVTLFSLSDDLRENDEWLFKVSGRAERILTGAPTEAERKVAQALNEFADNLERIERKYAEPHESEVSNADRD